METYILIFNAAGILGILFILLFDRSITKSGRLDIRYFRWLCVMTLASGFLVVFRGFNFLPAYKDLLNNRMDTVILCMETALSVMTGLAWLTFVDASAFHSPDRIKRRYRLSCIPLILMAALTTLIYLFYDTLPIVTLVLMLILYLFALAVSFAYIRYAWKMARVYAKEAEQPLILRLDYFAVPWMLCFINDLIPVPPLDGFFVSLAILLTWIVVRRRYHFLDGKTGAYTEAFLPELEAYADRIRKKYGSVIFFETKNEEGTLAEALKLSKPENSAVIRTGQGRFLLISGVRDTDSLEFLIRIVCTGIPGEDKDPDIHAKYHILNANESLQEVCKRV